MFVLCFVANKLSLSLALSQLSSHLHSVRDWSVLVMTSSQMMNNDVQSANDTRCKEWMLSWWQRCHDNETRTVNMSSSITRLVMLCYVTLCYVM